MKRKYILPFTFTAMVIIQALSSCQIEHDSNGDFAGFWHLERIDTIETGGVKDMSNDYIFWAVQGQLIHVRNTQIPYTGYFFRFTNSGETLVLYQPYTNGGHQTGDSQGDLPVTDVSILAPYGINSLEEHFHKDQFTGANLTLSTSSLRLYFKKF